MTFLPLLLLSGASITLTSDGSGFFPLPDSLWAAPSGAFAVVGGDTLNAFNSASGALVGLRVEPSPPAGVQVTLVFDTLPLNFPHTARLRLEPLARIPMGAGSSYIPSPAGEGLYISGVKRLGVSLGTDGGLVQGTRISLDGMLSPGVRVSGAITDESLPLGSASSEALSELDRVNLLVEGESWSAELGDMEREVSGGPLSPVSYRRSVSGAAGTLDPGEWLSLGGGYGVTGARRYNSVFLTQEGVQGPYSFAPSGVAPGSERVYLDGVLMQRGSGADYTVDYPAGSLTFSPARLIRRDQRVEVSCYREGDGFRRGMASGEVLARGGWLTVLSRFFREGDDTGSPLGFVMSPEAEEVLRNAGENPGDAWLDGASYVGEGEGSYSLDSLGRFVFEGPGGGDWTVTFQRPPAPLEGDYVYDSVIGGFLWAGEGRGTHLPRKYIDIPAMRELGGATLSGRTGAFSGQVSGYLSRRRGNLFNPEQTTREGTYFSSGAALEPWESGPVIFARGRLVSEGFTFPDESDPDSTLSRWLLPPGYSGNDSYGETGLESERAALTFGKRYLESGGSVENARARSEMNPGPWTLKLTAGAGRRTGAPELADGNRLSGGSSLEYRAGVFTPFLDLESFRESWADSLDGFMHRGEIGTLTDLGPWNLRVYTGGVLDRRGGEGLPDRVARAGFSGDGAGAGWSAGYSYNHSTSWFAGGGQSRADAILGEVFLNGSGWWANANYTAGGYLGKSVEVIYTWVGEGNGDYSYDPETGEYYPDPGGEYLRSFQSGEGEEKVLESRLKSAGSLRLEGGGLDASVTLAAQDPEDRWKTFLLAGAFDAGSPGEWTLTGTPWLSWEEGVLRRLTLRLFSTELRENLSGSGLRSSRERSAGLTPLLRPAPVLELELSGRLFLKEQNLYGPRRIIGTRISVDPRYIPSPGFTGGLEIFAENRRERNYPLDVTSYGLRPHLSLNTRGWSVSAGYAVSRIDGEGDLPSWFFDGAGRGYTLEGSLNAGKNLGRWFRLNLFFRGRRPAGGEWTRTGGLEGTVTF